MHQKQIKAYKLFNKILRLTLGNYLKNKFNLCPDGEACLNIKAPYLILPNHTNFWDPFLVSVFVTEPIYFVTSDAHFRKPLLRLLLKLVGAIPKTKSRSDSETVKKIIQVKKNKGVIGIFPEGKRNWDGKTVDLIYSTAKLVKNLKIPVIVSVMKGAYLSMPRWAKNTRKGKVVVSYKLVLTPDDIINMTVKEVYGILTSSLSYDEYYMQKDALLPYVGKKLAERLELFLFLCPCCKKADYLKSRNNTLNCTNCGYSVTYNNFGFFENTNGKLYFNNPSDWNIWQMNKMHKLITNITYNQPHNPIIEQSDTFLTTTGARNDSFRKFHIGKIALYHDKLTFTNLHKQNFCFYTDKISGINVQYNDLFEFYYEKRLYRFSFKSKNVSAYKWVEAVKIIKKTS